MVGTQGKIFKIYTSRCSKNVFAENLQTQPHCHSSTGLAALLTTQDNLFLLKRLEYYDTTLIRSDSIHQPHISSRSAPVNACRVNCFFFSRARLGDYLIENLTHDCLSNGYKRLHLSLFLCKKRAGCSNFFKGVKKRKKNNNDLVVSDIMTGFLPHTDHFVTSYCCIQIQK